MASLPREFNPDNVREFYAHAYTPKTSKLTRESMVDKKNVLFDRDTINNYLGKPHELIGGQLCDYQKSKKAPVNGAGRFSNGEVFMDLCVSGMLRNLMTTCTQIWTIFVLHNIKPSSHVSDISLGEAYIVWSINQKISLDVAQTISNEILAAAKFPRSNSSLPFPSLINELCKEQWVDILSD